MRYSLLLILAGLAWGLQAQIVNPDKVRFGKFSDEEIALKTYPLDPDAEAVFLFDEGKSWMDYDPTTGGFELMIERHQRIKILKGTGVDYATFVFWLANSTSTSSKEEVINIKGVTLNTANGEPEETKLTKEGIFEEVISDGLDKVTITFPQVKEGAIIDLKYTYKSDFVSSIPTWYFQRSIPTDYSYFEAVFPEYYYFSVDMKGFYSDRLQENTVAELGSRSLVLSGGRNGNETINFGTRAYRWAAKEIPGLKSETFSPAARNYFFRVDFELVSVNFPGQFGRTYSHSWDDIAAYYRKFSINRTYLDPKKEVADLVAGWTSGVDAPAEKLVIIYEQVKKRLEWNGNYRIGAGNSPSRLLELSSGSSGDLNYFLISALRTAGIAANPVLVSTRNNGYLSLTRPSIQQFNHVIVQATLPENGSLLLDASQDDVPLPLLPLHNLNDRGRLIMEESSTWVDLKAPSDHKTALQLKLTLQPDGTLSGTAKYKASGYAGLENRRELKQEAVLQQHLEKWTGQTLSEVEVTGFDNSYKDINVSAQMDASAAVMNNENLYYLNAIIASHYPENPLTTETRLFPIDLQTPQDYVYVLQLELGEGIVIEEVPESINIALPEGKGRYSLRFIELNGNLQIIEKLSFNDPFFYAQEYAALKNFFDLVVEQQQAMVVLRKE
ncbi:transglutaminase domain-containing protein [Lewinella sp. LCG006]|uniref:transglutaminase domain-containing protein n=1 Tax=Lewinella sp. LCG006 TaxID=3231911 RepID=UPI003460487E